MSDKIVLLTVGRGGYTKYGYNDWSTFQVSGYMSDPEKIDVSDMEPRAWVVSSLDVPIEDMYKWTLREPVPDPTLKPGQVERCPVPSDALLAGLEGSFKTLAEMRKQDDSFTGLDKVSVEDYVRLHRESGLPFKIGRVVDGKIQWEE